MKTPEKKVVNHDSFRKIVNKVLTSKEGQAAGLSLTENKHGAIQVKRGSEGIMFSATNAGVIVTHPMFSGIGKKKERIFKIPGSGWDNLSIVPETSVTLEMLMARVKDSKSRKDYHNQFYGKNPELSGLVKKTAKIVKAVTADAKTKKIETGKAIKRVATIKKPSKAGRAAITAVSRKPVAVVA